MSSETWRYDQACLERSSYTHSASRPVSRNSSPIATPAYGARNWSGAGSEAPAETTMVCSIAPASSSWATTCATVDCFWPMAT